MEQAWHLLRDAVLLIQRERYASSVVLATFCLEELGRVEIYRKNAKDSEKGKEVTVGSMRRDVANHQSKLSPARIPVTAALASVGEPPAPGSEAERQLAERLSAIRKIREKQAPQKAFDIRMRALYVDRIQRMPGWNRPSREIRRDDADSWVGAAVVRYDVLRDELKQDNSEIGKKISAGIEHLQLPEPPWDVWTFEEK
jgi:AbiV family abortive infection protein